MSDSYYINLLKKKFISKAKFDVDINVVNCDIYLGIGVNYWSYNENKKDTLNLVYHAYNDHSKNFDELQNYVILEYNIKNNKTYENNKFIIVFSYLMDYDYVHNPTMDIYDDTGNRIFNIKLSGYGFDSENIENHINNKEKEVQQYEDADEFYELIKENIDNNGQKISYYITINMYTICKLIDFLITEYIVYDDKHDDYKLNIIRVMSKMTPNVKKHIIY